MKYNELTPKQKDDFNDWLDATGEYKEAPDLSGWWTEGCFFETEELWDELGDEFLND